MTFDSADRAGAPDDVRRGPGYDAVYLVLRTMWPLIARRSTATTASKREVSKDETRKDVLDNRYCWAARAPDCDTVGLTGLE